MRLVCKVYEGRKEVGVLSIGDHNEMYASVDSIDKAIEQVEGFLESVEWPELAGYENNLKYNMKTTGIIAYNVHPESAEAKKYGYECVELSIRTTEGMDIVNKEKKNEFLPAAFERLVKECGYKIPLNPEGKPKFYHFVIS